ncbi:NitT/TauT family transport system permease protein [Sinosporangium album]|uniref:NitT/TauT family transport system permease protein n=1 Tax=Sinosporangium album TaxID=504805 RepID=A0A1G8J0Q8_9ACTN|nr:ABC transporter permease [Sinosporangium album]SDI24653.1 NitT/TauT family transport system permease protein [Sinosporangium album]
MSGTETRTQAGTQAGTQPQTGTQAEPQTESRTQPQTEAETQTQVAARARRPDASLKPPPAPPPPKDRATGGGPRRRWAIRIASLLAAAGLWQVLTVTDARLWLRFDRLPTLDQIAAQAARQLATQIYYLDLLQSLIRILTGFGLAAALGVAVGVLVARSTRAGDALMPLLEAVRPIPAIALVPVAILLFPTDEQGIVFITFAAAFFPIMVSTRHAVHALPTLWEDAVRTLGGDRRHVLWHVVLPGILPGVFGGLSVGMGVSWICVISAEMISGEFGVGYRTWMSYTIVDYPAVIVGMITIGLLGWLTSAAVELVGRRATRWLPRAKRSGP